MIICVPNDGSGSFKSSREDIDAVVIGTQSESCKPDSFRTLDSPTSMSVSIPIYADAAIPGLYSSSPKKKDRNERKNSIKEEENKEDKGFWKLPFFHRSGKVQPTNFSNKYTTGQNINEVSANGGGGPSHGQQSHYKEENLEEMSKLNKDQKSRYLKKSRSWLQSILGDGNNWKEHSSSLSTIKMGKAKGRGGGEWEAYGSCRAVHEDTALEIPLDSCVPVKTKKFYHDNNHTRATRQQYVDKMDHCIDKEGVEPPASTGVATKNAGPHGNKIQYNEKNQSRGEMESYYGANDGGEGLPGATSAENEQVKPWLCSTFSFSLDVGGEEGYTLSPTSQETIKQCELSLKSSTTQNRPMTLTLDLEDGNSFAPNPSIESSLTSHEGFESNVGTLYIESRHQYHSPVYAAGPVQCLKCPSENPIQMYFDDMSDNGRIGSQSNYSWPKYLVPKLKYESNSIEKNSHDTSNSSGFDVMALPDPPCTLPKTRNCLRRRLLDGFNHHVNIFSDVAKEIVKLRRVGHGHSSVVYHSVNVKTLNQVAIKEVWYFDQQSQNELRIDGLGVELDALRRQCMPKYVCSSPNCESDDEGSQYGGSPCPYIVNFYGMILGDCQNPFTGLVLEYAEFGTLADWASDRRPITEAFIAHVAHCLLNALISLREWGVLHKDIKPENILLCVDANGYIIAKAADFGISSSISHSSSDGVSTTNMRATGTRRYMSPEALRMDNVEHCSDIYSLGISLVTFANGGLYPVPRGISEFEQINHIANAELQILRWGSSNAMDDINADPTSSSFDLTGESWKCEPNWLSANINALDINTGLASCNSFQSEDWLWDRTLPCPSITARNFFGRCMTNNVALRPSADELLNHAFLEKKKALHWKEVDLPLFRPIIVQRAVDTIIQGRMNLGDCLSSTDIDWSQLPGFTSLARSLGVSKRNLEELFHSRSEKPASKPVSKPVRSKKSI